MEKWACPLDLRDFHVQFGPRHHRIFIRALERRLDTVQDELVKEELRFVLECFLREACIGELEYSVSLLGRDNHFDEAVANQLVREHIEKKNISYQKAFNENTGMMKSSFNFKIRNGILSGWKLTSFLGSTYNASMNRLLCHLAYPVFGAFPSDFVFQGDDTHFKTRFLAHSLFHFATINAVGKDAHPKKQFISSRYTEFLKTVYDIKNHVGQILPQTNNYSPCRMLASLQYEKGNTSTKSLRRGLFKDVVDTWNLFLVRIPDEKRRNFIINKRYPMLAVQFKFKLNELTKEEISSLFENPPRLGQYLLGPLVNEKNLIIDEERLLVKKDVVRVRVLDFDKSYEKKKTQAVWTGVRLFCYRLLR